MLRAVKCSYTVPWTQARLSLKHSQMETIAITEWNGVVSPLFDAACTWHCVQPDGSTAVFNVKNLSLVDKSELCVTEGIEVMICGAISAHARTLLEERGIRVLPWVCGPVASVIETYRSGEEISFRFAMPGCRGTGCRGRRRRGMHHRAGRIQPGNTTSGGIL